MSKLWLDFDFDGFPKEKMAPIVFWKDTFLTFDSIKLTPFSIISFVLELIKHEVFKINLSEPKPTYIEGYKPMNM